MRADTYPGDVRREEVKHQCPKCGETEKIKIARDMSGNYLTACNRCGAVRAIDVHKKEDFDTFFAPIEKAIEKALSE